MLVKHRIPDQADPSEVTNQEQTKYEGVNVAQPPENGRPYNTSYFVPGRIEGSPVQFLLDTGCTTNLISKHVFDRLPTRVKQCLQEGESHGLQADGSRLPFYGLLTVSGRLRDHKIEETFVVSQIQADVILGMPFLITHHCAIEFNKPALVVDGKVLACTDRLGRQLSCSVQVVRDTVIPPGLEAVITCRVTSQRYAPQGMVEGTDCHMLVAASLNQPGRNGHIKVRCLNPMESPLDLKSGKIIGRYTGVEDADVQMETVGDETMDGDIPPAPRGQVPTHLETLFGQAIPGCAGDAEISQVAELLNKYSRVFSTGDQDIGQTGLVKHSIPILEGTRPIRQPPHRLGPEKEAAASKQIGDLLERGLIEPSTAAWSSPVVLVKKKDGSWRFCVDYRRLNAVTQQDAYPLPRIDESLDALTGSKYFSTLDLASGYWQVPLDEEARDRSTFATRGGLWRWKVLPFGLTSAPATFQRLMERVLHGLHWKTLLLYLDDIIVIGPDFQTHMARLEQVLQRLWAAGLKLKPAKCELLREEVKFLGHIVGANGVATDPAKVAAVEHWPVPTNVKELKAFLGTIGYYHHYVEDFATLARPLTRLTSAGVTWLWTDDAEQAFRTLKQKLVSAPILGYPDPKLQYILDTDASLEGVGAVLSQIQEGRERPVAYFSKTLTPAERNYCVTRRELLAVVMSMKHFRPYLYGREFKLRSDHASLTWLCRRKEPSCQVARWLETLSEFQYKLEHRAGRQHGNADGLSRQACVDCKQCRRIEQRDGGPTRAEIESTPTSHDVVLANEKVVGCPVTTHNGELATRQQLPGTAVAAIYKAVQEGRAIEDEEVGCGGLELKKLAKLLPVMHVRQDGVLMVRVPTTNRSIYCAVCPPIQRSEVIWTTHRQAHVGMSKTIKKLQLVWYWPGMTADVRRLLKTCEVCQLAKHGGLETTQGRRRLHAGRPWQTVAVDLVGPMPMTSRGHQWILVLTDHFTRWQDALAIRDATAPVVATALDEKVFCYLGLPERLHSDQGAQFESSLMTELCHLWGIEKTRTTPYHPQANGLVERNNRGLGDSLRALLLDQGQDEWDLLLPHIMRAFRGTPHTTTGETANFLMMGRELRLPDQLNNHPPQIDVDSTHQYAVDLDCRLKTAHDLLRRQQLETRDGDTEDPLLFTKGDWVLLINKRRRKGQNPKLQSKFVGPYKVIDCYPSHTYKIERHGQASIQSEKRLKLYTPCQTPEGQAPTLLEPTRRPNMKGITRRESPSRNVIKQPLDDAQGNATALPARDAPLTEITKSVEATQNTDNDTTLDKSVDELQESKNNSELKRRQFPEGKYSDMNGGQLLAMPFTITRGGRISQPPERFQDFCTNSLECEKINSGTRTISKLANDSRLDGPIRSRHSPENNNDIILQEYSISCCSPSYNFNQPRPNIMSSPNGSVDGDPLDLSTSSLHSSDELESPVISPVKPSEKAGSLSVDTSPLQLFDKQQWPTLADSTNTRDSGRTSRPRLSTHVAYKPVKPSVTVNHVSCAEECQEKSVKSIIVAAPPAFCEIPLAQTSPEKLPKRRTLSTGVPTHVWLTTQTRRWLTNAKNLSKETGTCTVCGVSVKGIKVVQRHIPQHYLRTFCPCGHSSGSRDMVLRHQRKHRDAGTAAEHGGNEGKLYEVDEASFERWRSHRKLADSVLYGGRPMGITHRPIPAPSLPMSIKRRPEVVPVSTNKKLKSEPGGRLSVASAETQAVKKSPAVVKVEYDDPMAKKKRPEPGRQLPIAATVTQADQGTRPVHGESSTKLLHRDLAQLEGEMRIIRRASARAEELYDSIQTHLTRVNLVDK